VPILRRLRRLLGWGLAPVEETASCPRCDRQVVLRYPNRYVGRLGVMSVPIPEGELTALCLEQHGTDHTRENP
jgi:hypothetical protein